MAGNRVDLRGDKGPHKGRRNDDLAERAGRPKEPLLGPIALDEEFEFCGERRC